ncbi:MAG: hypothetical protein EBT08_14370 [Betaproteobacteria bacterium]|nr:hypothetical protein [Betaproteobacteria bacterium]
MRIVAMTQHPVPDTDLGNFTVEPAEIRGLSPHSNTRHPGKSPQAQGLLAIRVELVNSTDAFN